MESRQSSKRSFVGPLPSPSTSPPVFCFRLKEKEGEKVSSFFRCRCFSLSLSLSLSFRVSHPPSLSVFLSPNLKKNSLPNTNAREVPGITVTEWPPLGGGGRAPSATLVGTRAHLHERSEPPPPPPLGVRSSRHTSISVGAGPPLPLFGAWPPIARRRAGLPEPGFFQGRRQSPARGGSEPPPPNDDDDGGGDWNRFDQRSVSRSSAHESASMRPPARLPPTTKRARPSRAAACS